jgi:glycerol-3-phosphate dehydrogenase (NAD(P)+)
MERFGVVGAGAWGTALALILRRAGRAVSLWAREPEVAAAINRDRENPLFLPGVTLDPGIAASHDLAQIVGASDVILLAVPAQHLRSILKLLVDLLGHSTPIRPLLDAQNRPFPPLVLCAKGIEAGSGALLSEVLAEIVPAAPIAILSGPTFAAEVAHGLPTAVTLATTDSGLGERLAVALGTRNFRPYLSDDPIGAQIGGAVKNVLAIACGIVEGRRLGDNARAALITRGLAEMVRLAVAKGGRAETLMGLSGLGDLVLTCTGRQSRNYSLGLALGEGRALAEILGERRSVAEGVDSAAAAAGLAHRLGIEMPIVATIDAILHRGAAIDATIAALLARRFKSEG